MAEIRGHDWLSPLASLARIGEPGPRRPGVRGADAYCLVSVLSHQRSQATYPLQATNHDLPASGGLGWPRCSEPISPQEALFSSTRPPVPLAPPRAPRSAEQAAARPPHLQNRSQSHRRRELHDVPPSQASFPTRARAARRIPTPPPPAP